MLCKSPHYKSIIVLCIISNLDKFFLILNHWIIFLDDMLRLSKPDALGYSFCMLSNCLITNFFVFFLDGSFSMVSTTEIVEYMNKLLPDSQVRTYRNDLKMPSLILDNRERMGSRFISENGLVEDPIGIEKEKSVVNAWSMEEKEIFLNKYSLFGKNFKKISSFLQRRSIADCVEFYYKNHKSDLFQKIKKKSKFAKGSSSTTTNTYLVTSGKRLSQATSLDMLGAASAMVANVGTSSGDGDRLTILLICVMSKKQLQLMY